MPKAAPVALKLLNGRGNGTDSGGRKVPVVPAFVRLPPEAPEFLTGAAREEWERVVPELSRLRLVKPADAASLTAYCLAWQRLVEAQAIIAEEGLLGFNAQGRVRHPAVAIIEAASKDLRSWAGEFGLTPSSEQRVGGKEADDAEASPFG